MLDTKLNFVIIKNQVEAAEHLQMAGKDEAAQEVMRTLAKEILNKLPK